MADKRIRELVQAAIAAGDFIAVDPAGAGSTYKAPVVGTNGVIEYGSNTNGEYVRFADGTQIAWHAVLATYNDPLQLLTTWTFPAAFIAAPRVQATLLHDSTVTVYTATGQVAYMGPVRYDQAVTTGTTTRVVVTHDGSVGGYQTGDQIMVSVQAIGRWK